MTTLFEEMAAAGRGTVALLLGRRDGPLYFDFSLRGLAGSYIIFLITIAAGAYVPMLMGLEGDGIAAWQSVLIAAVLYALQVGSSVIVLNQISRLDGLVPFLVADNWATFYATLFTLALGMLRVADEVTVLGLGIIIIIMEINIARLVVTLRPLQVAMFLVARLAAGLVGLLIVSAIVGAPEVADAAAQVQ